MGFVIDTTTTFTPAGDRTSESAPSIARLLPSLTDLAVILMIVLLFSAMNGTQTLLADGDTGWHIRTGQWIMANGRIPHQDIFSYTMPHAQWFAWEWLWDVAFALIYNAAGLGGVALVSVAILCLTMALLFRQVRRKCGNPLLGFGVAAVAIAGSSLHWLARPHLFTLLFGVIFFSILERAKDALDRGEHLRARRLLWLLPAISALWANLHGGFVAGGMLVALYAAGETANWLRVSGPERTAMRRRATAFLLTTLGCALASLINPYFISLHTHVIGYLRSSFIYDRVAEFQSVSFHSPMAWTWEVMLVLGAISAYREFLRRQYTYALIIVVWAHLGLIAGRNIPIFMMLAAPIVAWNLSEMVSLLAQAPVAEWLRRASSAFVRLAEEVDETDRIPRLHLVSVAAVAVVGLLIYAPHPPAKFKPDYDARTHPSKALEFLGGAGIQNRIFTDDEWGDYLLYKLYPTKVYIDGRSDMYGEKFCKEYGDIISVKYNWEKLLEKHSVDTILLPTTSALAGTLKESRNWRVIYDDHVAIVFRPVASAATPGEKVSAVLPDGGTGRDRKITKSENRDHTITKTTT